MNFSYSLKNRITFYWTYFYTKTILLWFEVKKPKCAMFLHEMRYSLKKINNRSAMSPALGKTEYVETVEGKFHIRPHSTDMAIVSPAYERTDKLYLLQLLERLTSQGRKILVLDIGAHVGAFSIMVGNRYRNYNGLHLVAFEPDIENYRLLKKNIACNHLEEKVETCNAFLSSADDRKLPGHFNGAIQEQNSDGTSSLKKGCNKASSCTLDSLIGDRIEKYESIIMKIDTEGAEKQILQGAKRLRESGAAIHLLVEDFINHEVVSFLEECGAAFVTKRTHYNSWWKL